MQNLIVLVKDVYGYPRGSELHLSGEGAFYGGLADDERARLVAGDAPQVSCSCLASVPVWHFMWQISCALLQGSFQGQ